MPKYLKGFKSGRSSGLAPVSPRAWKPFPPVSPSRPGVWRHPHAWTGPLSRVTAGGRGPPAWMLVPGRSPAVAGPPPGDQPACGWTPLTGSLLGALFFLLKPFQAVVSSKPAPSVLGWGAWGVAGALPPGGRDGLTHPTPAPHPSHLSPYCNSHSFQLVCKKLKNKPPQKQNFPMRLKRKKKKAAPYVQIHASCKAWGAGQCLPPLVQRRGARRPTGGCGDPGAKAPTTAWGPGTPTLWLILNFEPSVMAGGAGIFFLGGAVTAEACPI